jgi:DNA-binding MarR family transcriptional regulator
MSSPRKRLVRNSPALTRRTALERDALLSARSLVDRMRALYRELERATDAPITVHRALACIGEEPGIPASRLAARLGMQRPAVSHVLKGLAARGWIERRRHERDQRSVQIHATADGQQILRATSGRAVGTLQRAVRGMGARQLRQLADGLAALLARLPDGQPFPAISPATRPLRRSMGGARTRLSRAPVAG